MSDDDSRFDDPDCPNNDTLSFALERIEVAWIKARHHGLVDPIVLVRAYNCLEKINDPTMRAEAARRGALPCTIDVAERTEAREWLARTCPEALACLDHTQTDRVLTVIVAGEGLTLYETAAPELFAG